MSNPWVKVTKETALKHYLYGVKGLSGFLLYVQIIAPLLTIPLAIAIPLEHYRVYGHGPQGLLAIVIPISEIGLGLWSWLNSRLLSRKRTVFFKSFWLRALCIVIASAPFFFYYFTYIYVGNPYAILSSGIFYFIRIPAAIFWILYLVFSRRLHVTLQHEVRKSDPWLKIVQEGLVDHKESLEEIQTKANDEDTVEAPSEAEVPSEEGKPKNVVLIQNIYLVLAILETFLIFLVPVFGVFDFGLDEFAELLLTTLISWAIFYGVNSKKTWVVVLILINAYVGLLVTVLYTLLYRPADISDLLTEFFSILLACFFVYQILVFSRSETKRFFHN